MSDDNLNFEFDTNACAARLDKRLERVQKKLDAQVLKDSNVYCPMDTGNLQKSAILATVLGSGKIQWRTPYAREQYYLKPNKSQQKNPNATMKWFETAKVNRLKEWEKIANEEYSKHN